MVKRLQDVVRIWDMGQIVESPCWQCRLNGVYRVVGARRASVLNVLGRGRTVNSVRIGLRDCLVCTLGKHWGFARVDNQPEPDKFLNQNFPGQSFTFMYCLGRLRCLGVAPSGTWPARFCA